MMIFVLEPLHIQERIVLECEKSYTCGRAKENAIICPSIRVSRKHCIFFHAADKLFVTDLKSGNGTFINGVIQEPYQMLQLNQDDIVGIGYSEMSPDNKELFAYKVCIVRTSDSIEIANTNDLSTTMRICDTMGSQKQTDSSINDVLGKKRSVSPNNSHVPIPCKIPKYTDNDSNNSGANPSEEIEFDNIPGPSTSTNISHYKNNSNVNNVGAAPDAAVHIKEENDIEIIYTTFPESDNWDIENCILKYETYLKKNNIKLKHQTDEEMDISVDEGKKNKGSKGKAGKGARTKNRKSNSSDKINDKASPKEPNFVHSNDQLIKLEDELQITDEDEEATTSSSSRAIRETTPIKLKKIKHEQKTQFSEIDVVDLSDNEDGIFPYSQLFDIKFKDSVKPEVKIKQECVSSDIEKAEPLDIENEVVILTDSDDDDNPWLQRLSRSQLMNEDKEPDTIQSVVKNEIDLGIWEDDDISKIIREERPGTSKDFDDGTTSAQSVGIGASEDTSSKEIPLERTSIDKKIERSDSTNLPTTKMDAMDVDDNVNLSDKPSLSENIDHATRQKTDVTQNAELPKQTEASNNKSSPSADAKHRPRFATTRRIIPMIDAPHLPPRRGRPKSADRKRDSSKDSRKEQPKTPEEKLPSDLTTEENKMQKLRERLDDHFYNKEPRPSKEASKGSPDQTASSKSSKSTSISKQEKKVIMEERKARLRKIAEDEKLAADSNKNIKRGTAKPRVKISLKNRGDFLCKEQAVRASKPSLDKSAVRAKSNSDKANRTISTCGADAPGSVIHDTKTNKSFKENVSKNLVNNVAASLEQTLCLSNTLDAVKVSEKYNGTRGPKMTNGAKKKHDGGKRRENSEATISAGDEVTASKSSGIPGECAPILRIPSLKLAKTKEKKKRVRFSANVDINEYEIESDNTLKRLIGKDAPIPTDKLVKMEKTAVWSPKIEEFLLRVFNWKPVWLEEQRYFKSDPPVVREEELQHVRVRYDSFEHYYNVALPLMLLETWQSMIKDFEMIEKNVRNATVMCSIVQGSIMHNPIPMTNLFVTTMMLEILVTIDDVMKQSYPKMGDLVSLEYVKPSNDKQMFEKVFAYTIDMRLTVITDFTQFDPNLRTFVKNPHAVITYNVQTRPIEHDILLHRVHRMRTIKYLRADLRMVQAVQYLPQSPLMKLILNPKVQDYQLPPMNASFTCASLVMEDKLNQKQLEAVCKVTEVVVKKEAKLCLIQGPPGTGKTKVIVNLVAQILYGNREHNRTDKIKILLCAPSNAAIDEIVMRLLVIRSQLKQRYKAFNLVRIGVPEFMHPTAKDVSPSELAKRNLRKFTENVLHWSSNRMNDNNATDYRREKLKLERRINKFNEMLSNSQNLTEAGKRQLKRELTDVNCQYELLMNRKLFDEVNPKDRIRYQRASEDRILGHADIIACTLSSCFTNQMESIFGPNRERFSVCIVDEATQSCEPESLIPLMLGINTLVLVGDPNQLPATILNQRAKKLGWDQSIFSRVQHAFGPQTNNPTIMLDTQYRMAYSISYFPNRYFYNCKLKSVTEGSLTFPFHPYRVLNHNSMQNNDRFSNTTEAEFVANIIYAMLIYAKWRDTNETVSLGVLTPYNNQRTVVMSKIHEKICNLPDHMKKRINCEVNTVDGFQGQERDIIIMSCVRSHGIGFLSDKQRLCVALTRAKHSLILCGNFNTFMKDHMWNALLADAKSRGVMCSVNANATSANIKPFVVK